MSTAAQTASASTAHQRPGLAADSATRRRWQILYQQLGEGREPCFSSERRHYCTDTDCRWRLECLVMRAQWQR